MHCTQTLMNVQSQYYLIKKRDFISSNLCVCVVFLFWQPKQDFKYAQEKKFKSLSSVWRNSLKMHVLFTRKKESSSIKKVFRAERRLIWNYLFLHKSPAEARELQKEDRTEIYRSTGWWPEAIRNEIMHCIWICFRRFCVCIANGSSLNAGEECAGALKKFCWFLHKKMFYVLNVTAADVDRVSGFCFHF